MRYMLALLLLAVLAAGCGGEPHDVPNVAGERLDVAADRLEDESLEYELLGGGTRGSSVEPVVAGSCPWVAPPPQPTPPVVPSLEHERLDEARAEATEA